MASFLRPMLANPDRGHALCNQRNGRLVAYQVAGAFDSSSRRKGLLGKECLDEGEALIIAPSNAIHTFFMKFPIDVAFVSRDGRVMGCRHGMGPWWMAASMSAYAVIELPAGTLARHDTRKGDVLSVVPVLFRESGLERGFGVR